MIEHAKEGLLRRCDQIRHTNVDFVSSFTSLIEVMQDVCCVVSAFCSHAKGSLEVRPGHIKLLWKVDNLFTLSDLDNRDCCPSIKDSDRIHPMEAL